MQGMTMHQHHLGMWRLLVSLLSLGFILARPQISQLYCYTNDPNPYLQFATKTPYDYSRGRFSSSDLVPEGCVAEQAWHLIRHGTRYPSGDDIERFVYELPSLQIAVLNAHQEGKGSLCDGDLSLLSGWTVGGLNTSWSSVLAPEGERELEGLASRYKSALPSLLDQPFTNDSFKFRHTATQRTEASAKSYSKGLFGDASAYIPPAIDPDPLLKFYEVCEKYTVEVDENPAAVRESELFWVGSEVDGVVDSVSRRLGFPCLRGDVTLLYDACRFYQAWEPTRRSPWCVAFTPLDLQVMEYYYDLNKYYKAGYGFDINTAMACPPLQDVYRSFSAKVESGVGPRGVFYFTHSTALVTVMSRLGLYHDSEPLTHNNIDPSRLWRTSYHASFATNLAFTLSNCDQKGWWVSAATSERMVSLEGCEGPAGCSWEEFKQVLEDSRNCNLNAVCALSDSGAATETLGWAGVILSILATLDVLLLGRQDP